MRHVRHAPASLGLSVVLTAGLGGCSIFSAAPTLELIKAAGTATSYALAGIPAKAQDTVVHPHDRIDMVCIAWNPQVPQADFVPALQTALVKQKVNSRVYDGPATPQQCPVWLYYSARMDWGTPPWGTSPQLYVTQATLSLRKPDGTLLSSSHYVLNGAFQLGKWAAVSDLIQPVVVALLDGKEG